MSREIKPPIVMARIEYEDVMHPKSALFGCITWYEKKETRKVGTYLYIDIDGSMVDGVTVNGKDIAHE